MAKKGKPFIYLELDETDIKNDVLQKKLDIAMNGLRRLRNNVCKDEFTADIIINETILEINKVE